MFLFFLPLFAFVSHVRGESMESNSSEWYLCLVVQIRKHDRNWLLCASKIAAMYKVKRDLFEEFTYFLEYISRKNIEICSAQRWSISFRLWIHGSSQSGSINQKRSFQKIIIVIIQKGVRSCLAGNSLQKVKILSQIKCYSFMSPTLKFADMTQ